MICGSKWIESTGYLPGGKIGGAAQMKQCTVVYVMWSCLLAGSWWLVKISSNCCGWGSSLRNCEWSADCWQGFPLCSFPQHGLIDIMLWNSMVLPLVISSTLYVFTPGLGLRMFSQMLSNWIYLVHRLQFYLSLTKLYSYLFTFWMYLTGWDLQALILSSSSFRCLLLRWCTHLCWNISSMLMPSVCKYHVVYNIWHIVFASKRGHQNVT